MKICAIVPAYNEVNHIAQVVQGLQQYMETVIVVDDGSNDGTAEVAEKAGAFVLRHLSNLGKGAAIGTGIQQMQNSDVDAFFVLDADAQHDWHEVPMFVDKMEQSGASIVIGNRMKDTRKMPLIRKWTNQFTSWIVSKLCGQQMQDSQCGYRLIQKKVVADINLSFNRFDAESEFLIQAARAGHTIEEVQIKTIYLDEVVSKINPIIDTLRFFKMVWKYRSK